MTNKRSVLVDAIRGIAILGILMMNAIGFSMPFSAYTNPTAFGNFDGLNAVSWGFTHLLFDRKFITLLSLLFGVGIAILAERYRLNDKRASFLHFKRMAVLLIFGLIHAYGIWAGDILFFYAICGALAYGLINARQPTLYKVATILIGISIGMTVLGQWGLPYYSENEMAIFTTSWAPPEHHLQLEIAAYTGSLSEQFSQRISSAVLLQTYGLFGLMLWFGTGLMILGIALYRQGLFNGQINTTTLLTLGAIFLCVGLATSSAGITFNNHHQWDALKSTYQGSLFNQLGSLITALGYLLLIVGIYQKGMFISFFEKMANVGRLALSNYLMQSIVFTFIFYGFGLGLFGQFQRWQLVLLVILAWLIQLYGSQMYLRYFKIGPFEYLWRKLVG